MSLLRRSSSATQHRRQSEDFRAKRNRRTSCNPVGQEVPPIAHEEPIGACEVSRKKRVAQVVVAVVYCLFSAGIIFGYAALKQVFIQEGVYRDQCTKEEISDGVEVCYRQELRLNLMFTIAAVSTNVCALPVGAVLDRFGPRICSLTGCILMALGCSLMGFRRQIGNGDGYIPGYLFLALGGPFIFISTFQLSNSFPRYSGLILAMVTGAFDASSAIFLVYRLIYQHTDGVLDPKKFFLIYLAVPIIIAILQFTLMPSKTYKILDELVKSAQDGSENDSSTKTLPPNAGEHRTQVITETTSLLHNDTSNSNNTKDSLIGPSPSSSNPPTTPLTGTLHNLPARAQILTPHFLLITAFTTIQMLRINYFVATIRPQYTFLLHSPSLAKQINSFFDVALPAGGVVAIPFIGLLLDNTSTPFALGVLVVGAALIGALGMLRETWAAYANVVLFVAYRPLFYTAISDYAAKIFGFSTFGTVYGALVSIAGIGSFLQTPADWATHGAFGNDPRPINGILEGVGVVVGVVLVGFVWWRARGVGRRALEAEAEGALDREDDLVPGHDERVHEDRHPVDVHGRSDGSG